MNKLCSKYYIESFLNPCNNATHILASDFRKRNDKVVIVVKQPIDTPQDYIYNA